MTISTVRRPNAAVPPLQLADLLGICLLTATLLILSYFRSRHYIFWGDEIMGWEVVRR